MFIDIQRLENDAVELQVAEKRIRLRVLEATMDFKQTKE
jgi:hypothetical protein